MKIERMHGCDAAPYADAIRQLLQLCDNEFVPPLSCRSGTADMDLKMKPGHGVDAYLEGLLAQEFILVLERQQVVGFMSYKTDYRAPWEPEGLWHLYVSTVLVHPGFRRRGFTGALYDALLSDAYQLGTSVLVRTWSTNVAHVSILERLGFERRWIGVNDRGAGIDTVYYILE